ncbi:MAG: hypothetical protein JSV80_12565 [Acidobacteriota bacterium]|nr:MAG: hypothetical protein JSV80_12565 [Acidobacteriota bacterium]
MLLVIATLLVAALALAAAVGAWIPIARALVVVGLGVLAAWRLSAGGRAAAWLFAIWCATTLVIASASLLGPEVVGQARLRAAMLGGLIYLLAAGAAFWSCRPNAAR